MKLPIGKYKNQDVADVPLEYLRWFEENIRMPNTLRAAINHEIERRTGDRSSLGRVVSQEEVERQKHSR